MIYFYGTGSVDNSNINSNSDSGIGIGFPIPIEITPFCYKHTINQIINTHILKELAGCTRASTTMRTKKDSGELFVTDNGNYIVDIKTNIPISHSNVVLLDRALYDIVGVVGTY